MYVPRGTGTGKRQGESGRPLLQSMSTSMAGVCAFSHSFWAGAVRTREPVQEPERGREPAHRMASAAGSAGFHNVSETALPGRHPEAAFLSHRLRSGPPDNADWPPSGTVLLHPGRRHSLNRIPQPDISYRRPSFLFQYMP